LIKRNHSVSRSWNFNSPVRWYTVVDEMSVNEMSVDEMSWTKCP